MTHHARGPTDAELAEQKRERFLHDVARCIHDYKATLRPKDGPWQPKPGRRITGLRRHDSAAAKKNPKLNTRLTAQGIRASEPWLHPVEMSEGRGGKV